MTICSPSMHESVLLRLDQQKFKAFRIGTEPSSPVSLKHESMPTNSNHKTAPAFDDLPLRAGDPPYSAWGLWGEDDNIGTLVCVWALVTCIVHAKLLIIANRTGYRRR